MATMTNQEVVDLLILVDATASMSNYLYSLKQSLPQIISISGLTNCFERIGLLAYRDYSDSDLLEWSGWMTNDTQDEHPDLVEKAGQLHALGGGDYPEATKTGLAQAYKVMRAEAKTLILLYTDAPPHMIADEDNGYSNGKKEQKALLDPRSYDGCGPLFADWAKAANTLRGGEKKAQVMCVLNDSYGGNKYGIYNYLCAATGGECIILGSAAPRNISEITIELLLAWMGVKKEGAAETMFSAQMSRYVSQDNLLSLGSESDPRAKQYFLSPSYRQKEAVDLVETRLTSVVLEKQLPKKTAPLQDFARTYKESGQYRALVTTQLRQIIERDVSAISLNPVFGSLWRTFCNDRDNDHRQELLDLFGRQVNAAKDSEQRARMKTWLDESYDYTQEVKDTIAIVPDAARFPCVCLDPTLVFETAVSEEDDDDEARKPVTSFRREELLELGRSCDWRILRRLSRVLTRLTFIQSTEEMPAHIAAADAVTKIPMALAEKQYGRKFWRILLHIVVPGTMLSGRAAALLAALAIRLGVQPLAEAAETEMKRWREKWNDIDVPETWNVNCLSLLMDADDTYGSKHGDMRELSLTEKTDVREGLLLENDYSLFKRLVDYKMLELNLNTTLKARVSWSPQKTLIPMGPNVICRACGFPRSVTIMGPDKVCGICCYRNLHPGLNKSGVPIRVSKEDNDHTEAYWCECNTSTCRAQYIVYNVDGLNVRPKCHYCRNASKAPFVECGKCLSRMIWPEEYRPAEMVDFTCMGCQAGRQTEVDVETTANMLREENGQDWLIVNKYHKLKQPFNNRTLFHTASNALPLEDFCEKVQVLPSKESGELNLYMGGKLIRNSQALVSALHTWVYRRRTESGTCSLCFSNLRKDQLLPACGRSGCHQRVCKGCLEGWYGLNGAGRIINTAALHCPFCRRAPTAKTLARHGMGVHAVGSLKDAVEHSGEWIYAWCADCGHAKQYMERVCAGGAPPEIQGWTCDDCQASKGAIKLKTRPCPGCGIETEKIGGCDHIQCQVPDCGVHWCFFCGEKQEEDSVYEHMNNEHGGYYGGREEEEEEDEGEVEDEL